MMKKIICIMGPTASGKSAFAFKIAEKIPVEIISVDSAQIYRGMDIGTAKPSIEEQKLIPHHLIDIRDSSENYSAAEFRNDAIVAIKKIHSKNKTPLLVGGTMLYFKALMQGISAMPGRDEKVRKKIQIKADNVGWQKMHEKLKAIDPNSAARIHPNDPQRIQRALEVYEISGKTLTEYFNEQNKIENNFNFISYAINVSNRKILHQKIEQRFDKMLNEGFLDEVKKLFARGDLNSDMPAIRSVGYRQAWEYLEGKISFEKMREKAVAATRQLAKRQITWLRKWPDLHWISASLEFWQNSQ